MSEQEADVEVSTEHITSTIDDKFFNPAVDMTFDMSIIIPVYNNANFTKSAVTDLLKLSKKYEIIIVDNGSTDDTPIAMFDLMDLVKEETAELCYMNCPRNLGFGRANNKAYKHARGKNILFLNNDIRVKSDFATWPERLIEYCDKGHLVSANGGLLDGQFNFVAETNDVRDDEFFYLSGWCLAGSRETFDKLILDHYSHDETDEITLGRAYGPWDEQFFAYFEDDDLSWRAKAQGIPLSVVSVPVHHFGRMTSKKLDISTMYKRSQIIFRELWAEKLKK